MPYSSSDVRRLRTQFWESKHHRLAHPASLVASSDDPTALFTVAGMQPLVPYLSGQPHPSGKRLYNIQRCIRTNDIEEIGDNTHHTMFEMMGNRSLGDYFKNESLTRTIEFLTHIVGIPLTKLGGTVFWWYNDPDSPIPFDHEAKNILISLGIPEHAITSIPMIKGKKCDNFWWPAGTIWPCGPCCEIYYDRGDEFGPQDYDYTDNPRYVEIWNNVFMDSYKNADGSLTPLAHKNIDTGMGFERLITILTNAPSAYETDLFQGIITTIEHLTQASYNPHSDTPTKKSIRIIAEHARACAFLAMDGVNPSNEGRGYIMRRLLRRMWFHLLLISHASAHDPLHCATELVNAVTAIYQADYPRLAETYATTMTIRSKERTQFSKTIAKWRAVLDHWITKNNDCVQLPWDFVFQLHDTYGLPPDISDDILRSMGKRIDRAWFDAAKQRARDTSKQGADKKFGKNVDRAAICADLPKTHFVGYTQGEVDDANILKHTILDDGRIIIITDKTPLYAESGGQCADHGTIITDDGQEYTVYDVIKYDGVWIHMVQ